MNIHADDIGLSIVVPGSSLVVHTYTLWLYATLLLYMRFLHGARARQRLITELVSFHELWKETTGNLNTKMLVQQKPQSCFISQLLAN